MPNNVKSMPKNLNTMPNLLLTFEWSISSNLGQLFSILDNLYLIFRESFCLRQPAVACVCGPCRPVGSTVPVWFPPRVADGSQSRLVPVPPICVVPPRVVPMCVLRARWSVYPSMPQDFSGVVSRRDPEECPRVWSIGIRKKPIRRSLKNLCQNRYVPKGKCEPLREMRSKGPAEV